MEYEEKTCSLKRNWYHLVVKRLWYTLYIAQNMPIIDPSTRTKLLYSTDIKVEWYNDDIVKLIQKPMFHTFAEKKTETTAGLTYEFITFFGLFKLQWYIICQRKCGYWVLRTCSNIVRRIRGMIWWYSSVLSVCNTIISVPSHSPRLSLTTNLQEANQTRIFHLKNLLYKPLKILFSLESEKGIFHH